MITIDTTCKDMPNSRYLLHGNYFLLLLLLSYETKIRLALCTKEHLKSLPEKAGVHNAASAAASERGQETVDISESKMCSFRYIWNSAVEKVHSFPPF